MEVLVKNTTAAFSKLFDNIKIYFVSLTKVFNKPFELISKFINNIIRILFTKPTSRKDYVTIGKLYISKKLLTIITLVVIAGLYCLIGYAYPWADGVLWTSNINVSSEKYKTFSGKARVHDLSGKVVFEGKMDKGNINGYGIQYNSAGELIYKGNYEENKFSGQGESYTDGVLTYKGEFKNNLYEGEGELYAPNGVVIYSGSFIAGQKSGKGTEYTADKGLLSYYGDFLNDQREGEGKAYAEDGKTVIYEGQFIAGEYHGEGKAFEDNKLIYQGGFANGLYKGEGIYFDIESGNMIYNGEFVNGLYEGTGKLYDPTTNMKIYEGSFEAGKREGEGISFDKLGSVSFSGEFKSDSIDYISYIGKSSVDITTDFGKESYRTEIKNGLILTYSNLNVSMIFGIDSTGENYVLNKLIMGMKMPIFGIKANATETEISESLGELYSMSKFTFDTTQKKVFGQLGLSLKGSDSTPSEKYLMDSYYIRLYYSQSKDKIESIEVGTI